MSLDKAKLRVIGLGSSLGFGRALVSQLVDWWLLPKLFDPDEATCARFDAWMDRLEGSHEQDR